MCKIAVAFSASIVLLIGLALFPEESVPPGKKIVEQEPLREVPAPPRKSQPEKSIYHLKIEQAPNDDRTEAPSETIIEESAIIEKLERQGVPRELSLRLETEQYAVPDDVFEHLSKASNWMPELQKAASSIMIGKNSEPSMLRIYDVADDSILLEFGFRDGDIIALVNGELPVFTPSRTVEYARKAYSFIDDLQNGKPISITVLRNGQPVNLVYQKW